MWKPSTLRAARLRHAPPRLVGGDTARAPLGETSPALLVSAPEGAAVHGGAEALPDRHLGSPAVHERRPEGGGGDNAEVGGADAFAELSAGQEKLPTARSLVNVRVLQSRAARQGVASGSTGPSVESRCMQHRVLLCTMPPRTRYRPRRSRSIMRARSLPVRCGTGGTHAAVEWDCCDDAVDGPAASSTARCVPPRGCTPPEAGGDCGGALVSTAWRLEDWMGCVLGSRAVAPLPLSRYGLPVAALVAGAPLPKRGAFLFRPMREVTAPRGRRGSQPTRAARHAAARTVPRRSHGRPRRQHDCAGHVPEARHPSADHDSICVLIWQPRRRRV
ncbi:hypothetical protein CUR178_02717 [Leishmania enriettii]|uniref:Uncharacterized protein n=1 Tax=Leishmania enriettii TaxID=5663 RepID=A0A836GEI8_LEIEN|nr:hypothetical protein CUR178_02717 [Leishmania enriettii]